MLCQLCTCIDLDEANIKLNHEEYLRRPLHQRAAYGYKHHRSWNALTSAADDGCELCQALRSLAIDSRWINPGSQLRLRIRTVGDGPGFVLLQEQPERTIAQLGVFETEGLASPHPIYAFKEPVLYLVVPY